MPGLRIALHDALCERRVDGALHSIGVIALLNSDGCMTHSDSRRARSYEGRYAARLRRFDVVVW